MTPALYIGVIACLAVAPLRTWSQTWNFSTLAGMTSVSGAQDGTNFEAQFNFPNGIAVDKYGTIYVSDLLNHTVRQVAPEGTNWVVRTMAGLPRVAGWADGTNGDARFDHPAGIAVDPNGNVFVADKYNDCIRKLTPSGTNWIVTTIAGEPGVQSDEDGTNNAAHFWGPAGLALDIAGNLYVADSSNFTIRQMVQYGTNWVVSTIAGTPLFFGFDDGTNDLASFDYPWGVTVNQAGTLFVVEYGNYAIRRIDHIGRDWVTTTIAGSGFLGTNDGPGWQATFNHPSGIAVDRWNNVYVTDYENHTLRGVTFTNGDWTVSTVAGVPLHPGTNDGPASVAMFDHPRDITVDRTGALVIADYRNQTIRMGVSNPLLLIDPVAGGQIAISWPMWASDYVLETSPSLGPTALWIPVTNGISSAGNRFFLATENADPGFFRLRQASTPQSL